MKRRAAVMSVMTTIEDALVLTGRAVSAHDVRPLGYGVSEFEWEGWLITVKLSARRSIATPSDGAPS